MVIIILQVLWFFLPALVANMAPVLVAGLPWLDAPLDRGMRWRGQRLLGDHKTVRGLAAGVIFGSITSFIQYLLSDFPGVEAVTIVGLTSAPAALGWGGLLGAGALAGDALKSFVKRQLHIAPGTSWKPWDQIDVVIGVLLVTAWWQPLSLGQIVTAFIVVGMLSYVTSVFGVRLKIKKSI